MIHFDDDSSVLNFDIPCRYSPFICSDGYAKSYYEYKDIIKKH